MENTEYPPLETYCMRCGEQVFTDSEHWCLPEKIDEIIELLKELSKLRQ